ncbi:MAG: OsmC family protein [Candidatus Binatia bacterium]
MMQYASVAMKKGVPIDTMKMTVRGHHSRESRAFKDMIFEIRLEGSASTEQAEGLAREASARCFVENTLAKAIPLTTEVYLNGSKFLTLARGPEAVP